MNKWWKTLIFIGVAALLTRFIPYSSFFRNVDTLVHEFGHALMTLVLSGDVQYIHLFADHSGITYSTVTNAWRLIPISLSGYIVSALFAWLLFVLYRRQYMTAGLVAVTMVAIVSLVFFVRNEYGIFWCVGFIILNAAIYMAPWEWLKRGYYLLISFILMVDSVISAITLLLVSVQQPYQAGDAANLYQATGIPSVLWALLFILVATVCARLSMGAFLGHHAVRGYTPRRNVKPRR